MCAFYFNLRFVGFVDFHSCQRFLLLFFLIFQFLCIDNPIRIQMPSSYSPLPHFFHSSLLHNRHFTITIYLLPHHSCHSYPSVQLSVPWVQVLNAAHTDDGACGGIPKGGGAGHLTVHHGAEEGQGVVMSFMGRNGMK
jgi:hypothetical protein